MMELLRPHLLALPPYVPIEPFEVLSARLGRDVKEIIKLDANENPYGISPKVRQALAQLAFPHIYPDPESRALRSALAQTHRLPMENILCGSGADELIDLILRVTLEKDDVVISCPPTFGMYPFDTLVDGGRVVEVPRQADFTLDMDGLKQAIRKYKPKILFLASPNNPDGSMLPAEVLEELLAFPLLVVLDEAYIEFSEDGQLGSQATRLSEVLKRENLIVLRTFSKWAGLAGLRVGFGCFPAWIMPTLWKAKQPYNVNVAASEAAIAALADIDYIGNTVAMLCKERQHMLELLARIPYLQPYPSRANFILCKVNFEKQGSLTAAELKATLASRYGILVRYFDKPGLQDHIRISVGKPEHTEALINALHEIGDMYKLN